jgi:hypothetical protein
VLRSRWLLMWVACSLSLSSAAAIADEDRWATTFISGNAYQIAARCYTAGMYYPHIWSRADEDYVLMKIMDDDPHLNAELTQSHFYVQPSQERLNLFMIVLGDMYLSATDFNRYPLDVPRTRAQCNSFLNTQGYKTFP